MFRRRTFGRGFRRPVPREPVVWSRSLVSTDTPANVKGNTVSLVLFDPSTEVAGSVDERLTLRKLMIGNLLLVQGGDGAGTVVAGDVTPFYAGICILKAAEVGVAGPSPSLSSTADKLVDWLWLQQRGLVATANANSFATSFGYTNRGAPADGLVELKALRKMTIEDRLVILFRGEDTIATAHHYSTLTLAYRLQVSVLFQRTMRTR